MGNGRKRHGRPVAGPLIAQLLEAAQHDPRDAASGLAASQRTYEAARRAVSSGIDPARPLQQAAFIAAALLQRLPADERAAFLGDLQNPREAFTRRVATGR